MVHLWDWGLQVEWVQCANHSLPKLPLQKHNQTVYIYMFFVFFFPERRETVDIEMADSFCKGLQENLEF